MKTTTNYSFKVFYSNGDIYQSSTTTKEKALLKLNRYEWNEGTMAICIMNNNECEYHLENTLIVDYMGIDTLIAYIICLPQIYGEWYKALDEYKALLKILEMRISNKDNKAHYTMLLNEFKQALENPQIKAFNMAYKQEKLEAYGNKLDEAILWNDEEGIEFYTTKIHELEKHLEAQGGGYFPLILTLQNKETTTQ